MAGIDDLRVELEGAAELAAAFARAPETARRELVAASWQASLLLQREVQERTPVGVGGGGGLKGSISAREPRVLGDRVIGDVATPLAYAVPVELGSKPHFPPVEPLVDWVKAKLGKSGPEARRIAFAVALKIAEEGTEGAQMFSEGLKASREQIVAIFEAAQARIRAAIVEDSA